MMLSAILVFTMASYTLATESKSILSPVCMRPNNGLCMFRFAVCLYGKKSRILVRFSESIDLGPGAN